MSKPIEQLRSEFLEHHKDADLIVVDSVIGIPIRVVYLAPGIIQPAASEGERVEQESRLEGARDELSALEGTRLVQCDQHWRTLPGNFDGGPGLVHNPSCRLCGHREAITSELAKLKSQPKEGGK